MNRYLREHKAFVILFLIAVAIRFINIFMPVLEGTATRQVQTAMIARNFYTHGFDIMHPEVDHLGPGKTCLILEFPLLNLLSALGYKALGGVHESVGRLWSILFFALGLILFYLLIAKIFNKRTAFWAGFVFSFSPLSIIFSRAFMPDFEAIFFCLGAIYCMYRYSEEDIPVFFWLSSLFSMVALLTKIHSFYIAAPLLYLLFKKEGLPALARVKNWIYLIIALTPAVIWYIRAAHIQALSAPEEAYNFNILHWMKLNELLSPRFYDKVAKIYTGPFLTPIGLTLFILGLCIRTGLRQRVIWAWLGGVLLFALVFLSHMDEPYYNLNVLPIASIFIARAIVFLKDHSAKDGLITNNRFMRSMFILVAFAFIARYGLSAYIVPRGYRYIPEAGKAVKRLSSQSDPVIASSAGGPAALYYCDRKGWTFQLPGSDPEKNKKAIEKLEDMRDKGATLYMSAVAEEFDKTILFKEYMFKNYRVVEDKKGKFILFTLKDKR